MQPSIRRRLAATVAALALGLGGAVLVASSASATTVDVASSADAGAGSLRQAVIDANGNPGPDTITISTNAITLTTGQIDITDDLTITGNDALTISSTLEMFHIATAGITVSMSNFTMTTTGGTGAFYAQDADIVLDDVDAATISGPAFNLYNGVHTISNVDVTGASTYGFRLIYGLSGEAHFTNVNVSGSGADGIYYNSFGTSSTASTFDAVTSDANALAGFNGPTIQTGSLLFTDSEFNDSVGADGFTATVSAGASLTATTSTADDNAAFGWHLHALDLGTLITASELSASGNTWSGFSVKAEGGSTVNVTDSTSDENGSASLEAGGGMLVHTVESTVRVTNFYAHDNTAQNGGGIGITQLDDGLVIVDGGTRLIDNTADNSIGTGYGGGLFLGPILDSNPDETGMIGTDANLQIVNCVISGNHADFGGGGIDLFQLGHFDTTGQVLVALTTIDQNTTDQYGGGISIDGFSDNPTKAVVVIDSTTISGNESLLVGGAIYSNKPSDTGHTGGIDINNSTITDNSALLVGGLSLSAEAGVGEVFYRVRHTTISANSSLLGPGGVGIGPNASLALYHDIIANSESDDLFIDPGVTTAVVNWNIVETADATATTVLNLSGDNRIGIDPLLGPLANNGGPTKTLLPLTGSPAIDTGSPVFAAPPSVDQRELPRVVRTIDIGAVEVTQILPATGASVTPVVPLVAILMLLVGAVLWFGRRSLLAR